MLKKQEVYYEFPSSDLENEKLKDTNGMDHASVPRKLRSAMKKRNIESVSKRLNRSKTGIESFKHLIKKGNQEMDAKASVPESMMISKDEKEVAETLYGLAGMFTEIDSIDKKTCDEKKPRKIDSILVVESDFNQAYSLHPGVSVLSSATTELIDERPLEQLISSTRIVDFLDRLKQSSSVNVTDATARTMETKVATSGLSLWPGLSSIVHPGVQVLSKSSCTKLPHWMGQAFSPSKTASLVSEQLKVQPINLKKCASHIYISRLIKALQTSKSSAPTSYKIEQRSSETSERRLPGPVTTISDFKTMVSPSKRYQNQHLLDLHKTHNPKHLQEDMTKLALELYNPDISQKQSYEFLTLSSAGAAQSHFPFPNSLPQYHISTAYKSQFSPVTSSYQQLSPYLANRFQTAYNPNRFQTAYNPNRFQPLQVASSSRYNNNVSQQQHRLIAAAAMSMSHYNNNLGTVINRQEHHFPLIYEDTRTQLQLLCNKQS